MPIYKTDPVTGKQLRGFAAMDPERVKEIAAKGGAGVDPAKRSFSRSKELASEAGKKGGSVLRSEDRMFAKDKGLAAEAGRKGGLASHGGGRRKQVEEAAPVEETTEAAE